jgi:hypothetical protein
MNENKTNPVGWILYDDSCGFCRRWVPFWENTLRKRGFGIATLQADWVRQKLQLNENVLLQDLRLLLANGEQIRGADTYRYAMKRIWGRIQFIFFPPCRSAKIFLIGATENLLRIAIKFRALANFNFYFFKNALNKSIGSGRKVVVLCSLAISRMVWR